METILFEFLLLWSYLKKPLKSCLKLISFWALNFLSKCLSFRLPDRPSLFSFLIYDYFLFRLLLNCVYKLILFFTSSTIKSYLLKCIVLKSEIYIPLYSDFKIMLPLLSAFLSFKNSSITWWIFGHVASTTFLIKSSLLISIKSRTTHNLGPFSISELECW